MGNRGLYNTGIIFFYSLVRTSKFRALRLCLAACTDQNIKWPCRAASWNRLRVEVWAFLRSSPCPAGLKNNADIRLTKITTVKNTANEQ